MFMQLKHNLSWGSWVGFLDSSVLIFCFHLSGEDTPTWCYYGDGFFWVSCLHRYEQNFFIWNPVKVNSQVIPWWIIRKKLQAMYSLGDMGCNWLHNLCIIYSFYEPTTVVILWMWWEICWLAAAEVKGSMSVCMHTPPLYHQLQHVCMAHRGQSI